MHNQGNKTPASLWRGVYCLGITYTPQQTEKRSDFTMYNIHDIPNSMSFKN